MDAPPPQPDSELRQAGAGGMAWLLAVSVEECHRNERMTWRLPHITRVTKELGRSLSSQLS